MATDLGTFNERSTPTVYALIKDDAGAVLDLTAVTSLLLTVWESVNGTILNGRTAQDVKNANGVTVYATAQTTTVNGATVSYNLKWPLVEAEMATVNASRPIEDHYAMFDVRWATTRRHNEEFVWHVNNLAKVTT